MTKRSRILQSPKQAQKKRKKLIITTLLSFFCVAICFLSIILFFRLQILQISNVEVNGTTTMNISDVQVKTLELLNGKYLGLIPKTNILFYPESFIESSLYSSFKKIDSIKVKRSGFSSIKLNIVERIPEALVCGGFHNEEGTDQKCYSADKDGYVYEESPYFSEGVYPHYYVNLDNSREIIGTNFIDTNLFSQLQKFISYIKNSKISTVGILISEKNEYELYIKNKDLSEAVVYFDDKVPFDKTASNLVAFWNDSVLKKKGTSTPPVFDYINLRFGNNIFYVTK